ncbi:MAG: uroporphyrinogen-III synthase [Candidatus Methanomethylophilaceae archaeon]|jgi:uroporphyrinogen-III synthase|nr:uroporphyrinogen-III synthase [Candidatus Methanomethylophilaceae archaeon]NLF33941.1 uroporphyrinogen-III synthase [Thermoplasmatales archaeon]
MITLAFTRPRKRLEESVALAEGMGFRVMAAPSLEISEGDPEDFDRAETLLTTGRADIVVFGSTTGVEECARAYGGRMRWILNRTTVVSIGPSTSRALRDAGVRVDSVPEDYSSQGLVDMLAGSVRGKTVLLIRSDRGSEVLNMGLARNGARVEELAAYRLEPSGMTPELGRIMETLEGGGLDALAFSSPMSASSFAEGLDSLYGGGAARKMLRGTCVAAIGGPTASRLKDLGRPPDVVPGRTTFADMLEAVKSRLEGADPRPS